MLQTIPKNNKKSFSFCEDCFEKQRIIDRLEDQIIQFKQKIRSLEKRNEEGYFGKNTPSSKKPFKKNTDVGKTSDKVSKASGKKRNNGGAKKGRKGSGRKSFTEEEADKIEYLHAPDECDDCGTTLISRGTEDRSVIDTEPLKVKKILYICEEVYCPKCKKWITTKPKVLNRSLYGNQFTSQIITRHFIHGITVGRIEHLFNQSIQKGTMHNIFHRVAKIFEPAIDKLIEEYRKEEVKHADETGWRTDGDNGYAWLFCSKNCSIFLFGKTRSAKIAREVPGEDVLIGFLVVDRYSAYNKIKCFIQYCYAHLLRKVIEYGEKYPNKEEVRNFVNTLAPLLSEAMKLRKLDITDQIYYRRAKKIKNKILQAINHPAEDFGIQTIQMIFKENEDRLYHWVTNRNVPAENNKAERELRPTVIARKVSFGSQSVKGAKTRSILTTILHTVQKRLKDKTVEEWLKETLDKISDNPSIDPYSLIPIPDS